MRRSLLLALVSPLALFSGCTESSYERPHSPGQISSLSGAELRKILVRNTLVGQDEKGHFWMHFPNYGTVWGKSSAGDVDIGRWWISGNRYCRAWRRWQSGKKACWAFASDGGERLIWISPDASVAGESRVQIGNTIGGSAQFAAVDELIDADVTRVNGVSPPEQTVPVDARGLPLFLALKDGKDPGIGGMDGGEAAAAGDETHSSSDNSQTAHDLKNGDEGGEGGGVKAGHEHSDPAATGLDREKGDKGGEGGEGG